MSERITKHIALGVAGMLLASSALLTDAAAQTVESDGTTVTAIRDLELNGFTYDVEFVQVSGADLYGNPPRFDFPTANEAMAAVSAVNEVLNAEGNAFKVGPSEEEGIRIYSIGYFSFEVDEPGTEDFRVMEKWQGVAPSEDSPVWLTAEQKAQAGLLALDNFADFIVVDSSVPNQPPTADPNGPYEGVAGMPVSFDGSGSSDPDGTITTHNWEFGDEASFGGEMVQHTYANSGLYWVTLTVTDDMSASDSTNTLADIGEGSVRPTADAGGSYEGTEGQAVTFDAGGSTDSDGTITTYAWDYGDETGVIETMNTLINHTYGAAGEYTVVLTVTDDTGNTDSTVTQAVIGVGNLPPTADAGPPVVGVVGEPVSFDGSGSTDPDDGIVSWEWDFGDGNMDSGETLDHTYAGSGDGPYTVTLVVTDLAGATDTATTSADIDDENQGPTADANGPYTGTVGVPVDFDASGSDDDSGILAYVWDFDDGTNGLGETPSHTYTAAGSYSAMLLVIDDVGATAMDFATVSIDTPNESPEADAGPEVSGLVGNPVEFNGFGSGDPDGYLVSATWDFGDGGMGSGSNPTHTYAEAGTWDVILTVVDNEGGMDQDVTQAVIAVGNRLPIVEANGPYTGAVDTAIDFSSAGSVDPDGNIVAWLWDFGDETSSTEENPSKTYTEAGLYNVSLTVTDDGGATKTDSTTANVGANSVPPVADAGGPYTATEGVAVVLDGSGSSDSDGTIVSWDWDFGDGGGDSGETVSHTYTATDTYTVTLTVMDDSGETDKDTVQIPVASGNQKPVADAGGPYPGLTGVAIQFDGTDSTDPDGSIASYSWDFGDMTTSDQAMPAHTYAAPGVFVVSLVVFDNEGGFDQTFTVVTSLDDVDQDGVENPDDTDNDNDGLQDKKDVDKDGDGWDFNLEDAAGTSDLNPLAFPGDEALMGPGVKSLKLTLNFAKADADSLQIKGSVPVDSRFVAGGAHVAFDFEDGALRREYVLDEKGKFKGGNEQVTLKKPKLLKESQTYISQFTYKLSKSALADLFPQFANDSVEETVNFRFEVTVDGETYTNEKGLDYKATADKKGTAKQPKPPKN